ncbi:ADYC domain-containing protein [Falsiroseomonas sp. HW251]|uniref:ADYC domain-containing protein n=1 Tax=Falsiroseomonas sp. HW251 TaxID=3390998 RepID=UPI003D310BB2
MLVRLLLLLLLAAPAVAQPRLTRLAAEGGDIRAELSDGRVLRGADLVGGVLHFDGLDIRLDAARRDGGVPGAEPGTPVADVWLFRLSARAAGAAPDAPWAEFCEPDPQGERLGLAMPGPGGALAFTCSAGGNGKCIRFGYRPWAALPDGRSLGPFHAACVNLLRAAYGGGEHGFTRDGTAVDIYDRVGIQSAANDPGQAFEAGWAPDGAVCVAHPRIPENGDLAAIVAEVPRLAGRTGPEACDEARAAALGALVFNRSRRR